MPELTKKERAERSAPLSQGSRPHARTYGGRWQLADGGLARSHRLRPNHTANLDERRPAPASSWMTTSTIVGDDFRLFHPRPPTVMIHHARLNRDCRCATAVCDARATRISAKSERAQRHCRRSCLVLTVLPLSWALSARRQADRTPKPVSVEVEEGSRCRRARDGRGRGRGRRRIDALLDVGAPASGAEARTAPWNGYTELRRPTHYRSGALVAPARA